MFQTAGFGVFIAFVLFVGFFARMMWRTLVQALSHYHDTVTAKAGEAENILVEARTLLENAQKEAQDLSQQLANIKENTATQLTHIKNQEAQLLIAFKQQARDKADADIAQAHDTLKKQLLSQTLETTLGAVTQSFVHKPAGVSVDEAQHLHDLFKKSDSVS